MTPVEENKYLRGLLKRLLECEDSQDLDEAERFLTEPQPTQAASDESKFLGRRSDGEECAGKCRCSSTFHTAVWTDEHGKKHRACSRCECACMDFVSSGKPNEKAR